MIPSLDGETRLHLIVGDPIAQTSSPAGLTREFAARNANAVCVPVHVAPGDFDAFMRAAKRVQNIDGFVITIPHKFAALAHCDETSDHARRLGAVNLLHRLGGGRWRGDMTDGTAMVAALRRAGFGPSGTRALVVGAGGAGSAVALALIEAGASALALADLDPFRRNAVARRLGKPALVLIKEGPADPAGYTLVVNATPLGMKPTDPLPIDVTRLEPAGCVADLVTKPPMTALLEAARRCGCTFVTGEDVFAVQAGIMADILLAKPSS
jgi:shikimate dehydrogenase